MVKLDKVNDLQSLKNSDVIEVFIKETWTIWEYDCVLMNWHNTGMAE